MPLLFAEEVCGAAPVRFLLPAGCCRCTLLFAVAVASGSVLHRLPVLRSGIGHFEASFCVALGILFLLRCSGTRSGK